MNFVMTVSSDVNECVVWLCRSGQGGDDARCFEEVTRSRYASVGLFVQFEMEGFEYRL
jgi:hypothetical protein